MKSNKTNNNYRPKILKSAPVTLADGTNSYTVAISYPKDLFLKIKKIAYNEDANFSEVLFKCIDNHQNKFRITSEKHNIPRGNKTSPKSVRFRESQVEYIEKVCEIKNIKNFTHGVFNILFDYFDIQPEKTEERD